MKKLILVLIFGTLLFSCSNNDDSSSSTPLSNTPDANAAYNNRNYGIYKGIFVGSSGTVFINIMNKGTLSAKMVIDGVTYNFKTEEKATKNMDISDLTFTCTTGNLSLSFDFSVNGDGTNPTVYDIKFGDHPADILVIKEDSDHLVKCYQGTYNGNSSGVFNFAMYQDKIYGLSKPSGNGMAIRLEGLITDNSITGNLEDAGTFIGTTAGNDASGTWDNHNTQVPQSGTWSGSRKL